jgi:hypothetical protein
LLRIIGGMKKIVIQASFANQGLIKARPIEKAKIARVISALSSAYLIAF